MVIIMMIIMMIIKISMKISNSGMIMMRMMISMNRDNFVHVLATCLRADLPVIQVHRCYSYGYEISNIKYQTSNTKHIKYLTNMKYCIFSDILCQWYFCFSYGYENIKHQISNIKYQTSNIKYQTSNIKHQISNIKYLKNIKFCIFIFQWLCQWYLEISNIKYQTSNIRQISNIAFSVTYCAVVLLLFIWILKYQTSNHKYLTNIRYCIFGDSASGKCENISKSIKYQTSNTWHISNIWQISNIAFSVTVPVVLLLLPTILFQLISWRC